MSVTRTDNNEWPCRDAMHCVSTGRYEQNVFHQRNIEIIVNQLDDRIKTLQYVLNYSDFSIFCAEVTDMFRFMMPLWVRVEFDYGIWYYSAIFHLKGNEQLKFVICDEGFTKHKLLHKKRLSGWQQLFDTTEFQGTNCLNDLHKVLIYYRINLESLFNIKKKE